MIDKPMTCEEASDNLFEMYGVCLVSNQAGVYVPDVFCSRYDEKQWNMPKHEARICRDIQKIKSWLHDRYDFAVLEASGLLNRFWERYWDAWEMVEARSYYEGALSDDNKVTSWRLEMVEGDLFAIPKNLCECDVCCNAQCKGDREEDDAATD